MSAIPDFSLTAVKQEEINDEVVEEGDNVEEERPEREEEEEPIEREEEENGGEEPIEREEEEEEHAEKETTMPVAFVKLYRIVMLDKIAKTHYRKQSSDGSPNGHHTPTNSLAIGRRKTLIREVAEMSGNYNHQFIGDIKVKQHNMYEQTPVLIAGNEEQKKKYLGRLIDEPLLAHGHSRSTPPSTLPIGTIGRGAHLTKHGHSRSTPPSTLPIGTIGRGAHLTKYGPSTPLDPFAIPTVGRGAQLAKYYANTSTMGYTFGRGAQLTNYGHSRSTPPCNCVAMGHGKLIEFPEIPADYYPKLVRDIKKDMYEAGIYLGQLDKTSFYKIFKNKDDEVADERSSSSNHLSTETETKEASNPSPPISLFPENDVSRTYDAPSNRYKRSSDKVPTAHQLKDSFVVPEERKPRKFTLGDYIIKKSPKNKKSGRRPATSCGRSEKKLKSEEGVSDLTKDMNLSGSSISPKKEYDIQPSTSRLIRDVSPGRAQTKSQ